MTADDEAKSLTAPGPLRRTWEKTATVLAVIGLIDLSSQLIKWASLIHWIADQYAGVRAWLLGWLPFHIPPEWHDPIILLLVFFSVTNVGLYREYGDTVPGYFFNWTRLTTKLPSNVLRLVFVVSLIGYGCILLYLPSHGSFTINVPELGFWIIPLIIMVFIIGLLVPRLVVYFIFAILGGAILAWRWLLTTVAIFGALVAINFAYIQWLEPLAEHR